jgi:hypothetical protein
MMVKSIDDMRGLTLRQYMSKRRQAWEHLEMIASHNRGLAERYLKDEDKDGDGIVDAFEAEEFFFAAHGHQQVEEWCDAMDKLDVIQPVNPLIAQIELLKHRAAQNEKGSKELESLVKSLQQEIYSLKNPRPIQQSVMTDGALGFLNGKVFVMNGYSFGHNSFHFHEERGGTKE